MLIRPEIPIFDDILDISEFKYASREIIIYENADNDFNNNCQFTVINNCQQVGGNNKLSHEESLWSTHFYFGTIFSPFIVQNNHRSINPNATIYVKEHSYIHKLYNMISESQTTVDIFDSYYKNEYCRYENSYDQVLPPDIRYYTMDHQILRAKCDNPFGTEDKMFEKCAIVGMGMMYMLSDIIDSHTNIKRIPIKFDNPNTITNKIINNPILTSKAKFIPNEVRNWVIDTVTRLIHYAIVAFITDFTIIFDSELGYNITSLTRAKHVPSEYNHWENVEFATQIEAEWKRLCDFGYNVRLSFRYSDYFSNIQLLSLDTNNKSNIKNITRDSHKIVEENYEDTV
jgi:hypothetical protein